MSLDQRSEDELRAAIAAAKEAGDLPRLRALAEGLEASLRWQPQEYQLPPPGEDWWCWVARWGRGAGKSDTGSWYVNQHMTGPACDPRVPGGHKAVIVGPMFDSVVAACVKPPAGIQAHNAGVQYVGRKDGSYLVWPNGAEAVLRGAHSSDDAERLRGISSNVCLFWFDEAGTMRHLTVAIDNVAMAARLGRRPHGLVTSTPTSRPAYTRLLNLPNVVQTVASTYENVHLPAAYHQVIARYEGTRLGRQELYAEVLTDYEGALWNREAIERDRRPDDTGTPQEVLDRYGITKVVVGIDPSTWDPELGDDPGTVGEGIETGIVVAGIDGNDPPHVYVLDDASMRGSGEEWASRVARSYHHWRAADAVPEVNLGGLVLSTMRLVDPDVHLYRTGNRVGVRAAVGKRARAEPVATLAEQGRLHHVGHHPLLEDQLTGWDPRESWSPDRLDALVWAVTALEPWAPRHQVESTASQIIAARLPVR